MIDISESCRNVRRASAWWRRDAGLLCAIRKVPVAVVVKQNELIIRPVRYKQIGSAVVVVIAGDGGKAVLAFTY